MPFQLLLKLLILRDTNYPFLHFMCAAVILCSAFYCSVMSQMSCKYMEIKTGDWCTWHLDLLRQHPFSPWNGHVQAQ